MARRTFDEAQETRRTILNRAVDAFSTGGYDGLSIEALARNVSVTRGAVYHHFKNKEELFRAAVIFLLEKMGETILRRAEGGRAKGDDPWESLVLGCAGFLEESQNPAYQRIILVEGPAILGIRKWQILDHRYTTAPLVEVMEILSAQERIDVPHVEAAAQALSGAMNQLSLWAALTQQLAVAQSVLRSLLEGMQG